MKFNPRNAVITYLSSVGRFRVAERHEQPNAEAAVVLAGVRVEAWTYRF